MCVWLSVLILSEHNISRRILCFFVCLCLGTQFVSVYACVFICTCAMINAVSDVYVPYVLCRRQLSSSVHFD